MADAGRAERDAVAGRVVLAAGGQIVDADRAVTAGKARSALADQHAGLDSGCPVEVQHSVSLLDYLRDDNRAAGGQRDVAAVSFIVETGAVAGGGAGGQRAAGELGQASCRERVCQSV